VGVVLAFALVIVFPTAAGYAVIAGLRTWQNHDDRRRASLATAEPIEKLGANLRRLHTRLEETENRPDNIGKGLKLRAVRAAYVDALSTACIELEVVPPPPNLRQDLVPQKEIYRVEAALRQRGLDVRDRAAS
jgi:hypothetical protein